MIIRPEPVVQRIKRGTKYADVPSNPAPPLSELDSPFQYAEYLSLKVRHDPHDIEDLVKLPTTDQDSPGASGSNGPRKGNEKDLWVYEHLRRLPIDITPLVTSLLGTCTPSTCPKMKADEWQYLCVAHGSEGAEECSAIDYILHTLDSTTTLLNSSEIFPSRIQIPHSSLAHFPSLFRRLSRIFSHAYFHHRELFQLAEAETSLYARFVALCEKYDLVGTNLLVIPRSVVADVIDGKQAVDDEDDDEEDDEDEDEDDDEEDTVDERDSRRREKGESGRRPHSLDRHPRPHKLDDLRQKGEGTVKGWTAVNAGQPTRSDASTPIAEASESVATPAPASTETYALKPKMPRDNTIQGSHASTARTLGRSTLGRKGRGTMLWTSDTPDPDPVPSIPEQPQQPVLEGADAGGGAPLERTESVETAIMIDPEHDTEPQILPPTSDEDSTPSPEDPDVPQPVVPKDEIELLEEEGKIPPVDSSVSPLPPPVSGELASDHTTTDQEPKSEKKTEVEAEVAGEDDLQEIKLDESPSDDPSAKELPTNSESNSESTTSISTVNKDDVPTVKQSADSEKPESEAGSGLSDEKEKEKEKDETKTGSGMDSEVVEDTDKVMEHVDAGGAADEDPFNSTSASDSVSKTEGVQGLKSGSPEKEVKKGKKK